jgi:hypothetical protein
VSKISKYDTTELHIKVGTLRIDACLKSEEQSYGLQAMLSSINIVAQKQVVNIPEKINSDATCL